MLANGWTHRGETFTREQLLTGATVIGGNSPGPTTPPRDNRDDLLCCLLSCLAKNQALSRFLEQHGVDVPGLVKCLRACCDAKNAPPSDRELAEREGAILPTPAAIGQLSELLNRPDLVDLLRQFVASNS